ncbi:MAG: hypothetical protein HY943_16645 [Gammaproteobacteria bacterium]|nr:hypothetical protein [Gammaproteobacteria bacterium]
MEQPYGSRGGGTETHVKGILTKTLDVAVQDYRPRRLHFNVAWFHNWEPTAQERPNRYLVGLAYSQPLNNDTVLVAEVFREAQRQQDKDYNFANLGVRRQLTPLTLVTLGAGAGFGDDAPRWQVMVGFQHTLGTWPLGM